MMDRETIKSFASRMMDNDRMRSLAERTGFYAPPPSMIGRDAALLAAGLGMGAFIMYMLDPVQGRRRRSLARDQVTSFVSDAEKRLEKKARHYANRARGVVAEAKSAVDQAKHSVPERDQPF
jgi:hypothetical protein